MDQTAFMIGIGVMVFGYIGIFVPMTPGVPVMLLGAFVYSYLTGFDDLTWPWLLLFTLLTVASVVFDVLATAWVTRRMGSSRRAAWGAVGGTLVGVLFFGAYGALLGGVGGAFAGEYSLGKSTRTALRSGTGAFMGFAAALVADVIVGTSLLVLFVLITL